MSDIKLDLYGTWQHLGVDDFRADRASRRFRVTGLDNNNQSIGKALRLALDTAGLWHHSTIYGVTTSNTRLPLHYIEAHRVGLHVYGRLVYKRGRVTGGLDDPITGLGNTQGFKKFERFYRETEDENGDPAFDAFGLPAGAMYEMSPEMLRTEKRGPRGYMREASYLRLLINTVLPFDPLFVVSDAMGKTNSDAVTFGAGVFAANTILFEHPDIQASTDSQGLFFEVTYNFLLRTPGFWRQVARFEDVGGSPEWTTRAQRIYEPFPFAGQFPL